MRRLLTHPYSYILISIIIVVILFVIGGIIFGSSFVRDFSSNWLATLSGVIIGIPVALWLSRYQERREEKERKERILRLLVEELMMNVSGLTAWSGEKEANFLARTSIFTWRLKTQFWKAFSDGGELKWIKDPQLLSEIANAYDFIRMILALSNRYVELLHLRRFDEDKMAIKYVRGVLEQGVVLAEQEIMKALISIEEARKEKGG